MAPEDSASQATRPVLPTDRLDSWKEVATFLGRGVRTVQRWEREEGLPVHRLLHDKRGTVFAYRDELAAWWESRRRTIESAPESAADQPTAAGEANAVKSARTRSRVAPVASVLLVLGVVVTIVTGYVLRSRDRQEGSHAARTERITNLGWTIYWPTLSNDGALVAFVSDGGRDGAPPQIWMAKQGAAPTPLTECTAACTLPAFSADGTHVLYTAAGPAGEAIYEVPVSGGAPRLVRRQARAARWSPDGRWMSFVSTGEPGTLHVAGVDGAARALAQTLSDVSFAVWSPDSMRLLVRARDDTRRNPDWWVVPLDGSRPFNTRMLQRLGESGFAGRWHTELSPAWVDRQSLVFSDGSTLWRQRVDSRTLEMIGAPEPLTHGAGMAWFAASAGGRVAFVSSNPDINLRAVAIDPVSGVAYGPVQRVTRGPGRLQYPDLAGDGRTLVYTSTRTGNGDVFLRDLVSGAERTLAGTGAREAYSTISPGGTSVMYGTVVGGELATRPATLVNLADGSARRLCDDCRGRPRAWLDERRVILERPGQPPTLAVLDVETNEQRTLLADGVRGVANPRVNTDGRWIAFDAVTMSRAHAGLHCANGPCPYPGVRLDQGGRRRRAAVLVV